MRGSGKADVYMMLAHPVGHAKSPGMFNALFEERGLDALMVPVTCRPEDFDAFWAGISAMENLRGIIVSVPYKTTVLGRCESAHQRAARVQAANCALRRPDGSWHADNFDGVGFVEGLRRSGHAISGRTVLQVGAGGAGASLAYCLAEEGAAAITLHDIDAARAERLAGLVGAAFPECRITTGPPDPRGHSLVVNATPAGLRVDDPLPLDVSGLAPGMTVVDIIMEPRETPLLRHAMKTGCAVQFGQPMMDCQMQAMADFLKVHEGLRQDG